MNIDVLKKLRKQAVDRYGIRSYVMFDRIIYVLYRKDLGFEKRERYNSEESFEPTELVEKLYKWRRKWILSRVKTMRVEREPNDINIKLGKL